MAIDFCFRLKIEEPLAKGDNADGDSSIRRTVVSTGDAPPFYSQSFWPLGCKAPGHYISEYRPSLVSRTIHPINVYMCLVTSNEGTLLGAILKGPHTHHMGLLELGPIIGQNAYAGQAGLLAHGVWDTFSVAQSPVFVYL